MMGVLRYKIFRDLWTNKSRTLQVVLIIGIGAAAIGMIIGTRALFIPGMADLWRSQNPAMINLFVGPPLSQDDLYALKNVDGVVDIEGLSSTTIEWRLSPQDDWSSGNLTARADYEHQKLNKLELLEGNWPSGKVIDGGQDTETYFKIPPGGTVYFRVNDREYHFEIGGRVYDQLVQPAYLGGNAQFYATQDQYERLVGDRNFNQVMVIAAKYDETKVTELADRLQAKVEKQGRSSNRLITDPNKHFFQDQMDGLFFLLGILGALSLVLGLLLVYNTVNALIAQQVDQIGIMKAVGARTWQVLRLYLLTILGYGFLALLIALPLGILGAQAIIRWLGSSFGANMGSFEVSPLAVEVMVAITLLAPLLASLLPVFNGSRITVREAISTYGLGTDTGLLERLLARVKYISRLFLITISNTFRHKWRVFLLQISLVMSGLIFMMVISVQDSVTYTIRDVMFSILNADVTFVLQRAERIEYVEQLALSNPKVQAVEMWGLTNVTLRPKGQPESEDDESATLFGVPLPTQLYGYQLRGGRWLDPQDTYAIVLNQQLAKDVGVGLGDWVTVKYGDRGERDWRVVGLVFDPIITASANVPRDVLLRDLDVVGRAGTVWIKTTDGNNLQSQIATAKDLRAFFKQNNVDISPQRGVFGIGGDSTLQTGNTLIGQFAFIVILLGVMAVIIGTVGSIALSGALSLSVMERRREIGVMRAIGASSWTIARLFIGEGLILGWLSWLIALPLSMPAGRVMVQALGAAFNLDIVYKYTPNGAILWLIIITILSIIASWLPARSATRISVRESLAYQ